MRFDLALGFDHEAQAPVVAAQSGQGAERVAAGVPERVEQAGAAVQLVQAVGAPGQMVGFFLRRLQQMMLGVGIAGDRGLAEIQALRADLADVVDPHQAGGVATLVRFQCDVGRVGGRVGPLGGRIAEYRVQRALGFDQQPVERAMQSERGDLGHASILAPDRAAANRQQSGRPATCVALYRPVQSRLFCFAFTTRGKVPAVIAAAIRPTTQEFSHDYVHRQVRDRPARLVSR
ncbi:hypothetical protein CFBP6762_00543 [Xanthomonas arboricola pv. fragariae]|nr:hypothetical protein CFBP6762_00543 [Xanthomonas arboricola pv. fragariae]